MTAGITCVSVSTASVTDGIRGDRGAELVTTGTALGLAFCDGGGVEIDCGGGDDGAGGYEEGEESGEGDVHFVLWVGCWIVGEDGMVVVRRGLEEIEREGLYVFLRR